MANRNKTPLSLLREGDFILLLLCFAANLFGLLLIYSATRYSPSLQTAVLKQLAAVALGIFAYLLFSLWDMEAFTERFHIPLFLLSMGLLLLLIPFGNDDGTGNKSWINLPYSPFNLQPAELVKLSFVLLLALQFYRLQQKGSVSRPRVVLQTAGFALLFCGVIALVSGDMGMVLVYLFIYVTIAFAAGVNLLWFLLALDRKSVV